MPMPAASTRNRSSGVSRVLTGSGTRLRSPADVRSIVPSIWADVVRDYAMSERHVTVISLLPVVNFGELLLPDDREGSSEIQESPPRKVRTPRADCQITPGRGLATMTES